jgi:hypothetical protein
MKNSTARVLRDIRSRSPMPWGVNVISFLLNTLDADGETADLSTQYLSLRGGFNELLKLVGPESFYIQYSRTSLPTPAYRFVKTHPGHPPSLRGRGATDNGDTGSGVDGSGALNISRKCTHLRINT